MLAPNRIRFGGIFSNELNMPDLITDCAFDSDDSEVSTYLTREAVASEAYDGRQRRISSFKYTENFAPKFTFLKKEFEEFTQDEIRALLKYLTAKDTTDLLEVYDDDSNVVAWASIGNFSEIQLYKMANKRVVGVTAVWDSISPFAFSDLYTVTKTISDANNDNNKITIEVDTDDNKPIYPKVTINHGYSTTQTPVPHTVVSIPSGVTFNSITDMADYVENTVYHNATTNTYYYKSYTPVFTSSATLPQYVNWTTVDVDREYTSADTFAANTFYYYEYLGKYYWKVGSTFHTESSRPVYGDWKTKAGTKEYTASDKFEENTIYSYSGKYYWMAPYNFYKSSVAPSLQTTSVKITNMHTDFLNTQTPLPSVIVKNNSSTEVITLDGANRVIGSSSTRRIFDNDFENWQWLELRDGKNEIEVLGNCEITLSWREVRKIGEY